MHVGFYQARDNKGNSLNRSIMFVELDPDSVAYLHEGRVCAPRDAGHQKYVDVGCQVMAKLRLDQRT
jgi:hypothetical protein